MIKVRVPATSANLGAGFDALGLALNLYNTVWFEESDKIEILSKDGFDVPNDKTNLIYESVQTVYDECGVTLKGMKIIQDSQIPMTRGLGSSSACIVAGIIAANYFLGNPFTKDDLVNLACKIEGHPDNTTPAILGGITVSAMDNGNVYTVGIPLSNDICFGVFIPDFTLKTELARNVLPKFYSREDAVFNLSRSSLMIASLFTNKFENLFVATQDKLHQPYRLSLIYGAETVFDTAKTLGAYSACVSGAGPSIISFINKNKIYDFNKYAISMLNDKGVTGWSFIMLEHDNEGAKLFVE